MGRPLHRCGFVKGAIVQHDDIVRRRKRVPKAVHPALEGEAIEVRQFQTAVLPRGGFHRPIEREIGKLVRDGDHGLHPIGGNPTTDHGP
jgi:hypothetical protein